MQDLRNLGKEITDSKTCEQLNTVRAKVTEYLTGRKLEILYPLLDIQAAKILLSQLPNEMSEEWAKNYGTNAYMVFMAKRLKDSPQVDDRYKRAMERILKRVDKPPK